MPLAPEFLLQAFNVIFANFVERFFPTRREIFVASSGDNLRGGQKFSDRKKSARVSPNFFDSAQVSRSSRKCISETAGGLPYVSISAAWVCTLHFFTCAPTFETALLIFQCSYFNNRSRIFFIGKFFNRTPANLAIVLKNYSG